MGCPEVGSAPACRMAQRLNVSSDENYNLSQDENYNLSQDENYNLQSNVPSNGLYASLPILETWKYRPWAARNLFTQGPFNGRPYILAMLTMCVCVAGGSHGMRPCKTTLSFPSYTLRVYPAGGPHGMRPCKIAFSFPSYTPLVCPAGWTTWMRLCRITLGPWSWSPRMPQLTTIAHLCLSDRASESQWHAYLDFMSHWSAPLLEQQGNWGL
eukprot:1160622-Pelagomonas_calceolata.AAC.13